MRVQCYHDLICSCFIRTIGMTLAVTWARSHLRYLILPTLAISLSVSVPDINVHWNLQLSFSIGLSTPQRQNPHTQHPPQRGPFSPPQNASSPPSLTMLPEPALSFTLPSLHDGLALDCRVYHPLALAASPRAPKWQRHTAVVAHPYAPLGGSYDDPVVETVAALLLRKGVLVATFNFRWVGLGWEDNTDVGADFV